MSIKLNCTAGWCFAGLFAISIVSAATVATAETVEDKIARAMTAAPSDITDEATIMDVDGTILRAGTNGWVCLPGIGLISGDQHPMCNDSVWMDWMAAAASGRFHAAGGCEVGGAEAQAVHAWACPGDVLDIGDAFGGL